VLDFSKRRRFPVRFPRFSAISPDFSEEQHSRGGLYCFSRERFSAEEKRELEWREADERFEKRMQEQYEKTNAIIGRLGNRIGDFVEGLVRPGLVRLFNERGIPLGQTAQYLPVPARGRGDDGG
jgi:hypothetical protein